MVRQVFPERTIYHESQLASSVRALCPFARRRRRRGRPGQPKGYPEGDQTGHPSAQQERISCCNATTNTRKPQGNREATQTRGRKRRANLAPEGATNTAITLTTNVGSDESFAMNRKEQKKTPYSKHLCQGQKTSKLQKFDQLSTRLVFKKQNKKRTPMTNSENKREFRIKRAPGWRNVLTCL